MPVFFTRPLLGIPQGLSEVLVFKLFRTETATPTVPSPPIVITFDIIKHRYPHYFPADKILSMDTFHFQRMKEAFLAGIIVAAIFCAHTSMQIMPLQRHLQDIAGQLRRHVWRHRPANNGTVAALTELLTCAYPCPPLTPPIPAARATRSTQHIDLMLTQPDVFQ